MPPRNWMLLSESDYQDETNGDELFKQAALLAPATTNDSSSQHSTTEEYDSDEETVETVYQQSSWKSLETLASPYHSQKDDDEPSQRKPVLKIPRFSWWALAAADDDHDEELNGPSINKNKKSKRSQKARHSSPVTSTEHEEAIKSIAPTVLACSSSFTIDIAVLLIGRYCGARVFLNSS